MYVCLEGTLILVYNVKRSIFILVEFSMLSHKVGRSIRVKI